MKREFKVGDEVYVYQDTKSEISNIFGKGMIIRDGAHQRHNEDRLRVEYYPNEIIETTGYVLWVHPDDMRPLTKLDKALK